MLARLLAPPLCWSCRAAVPGGLALCPLCRAALRWLPARAEPVLGVPAWAPVAYEGPARALVRGLKFSGAEALAGAMAAPLAALAPAGLLQGALVPVPLHPARRRRRGFDQAERLAAALAGRTGLSLCACLERRGRATRQAGRPRRERLALDAAAYASRAGARAPPRAILVDDVITTGATLAACAGALRAVGAREVVAVAYARTPGR